MKNEKIINAWDVIIPSDEAKRRILKKVRQNKTDRHPAFKKIGIFAMAAIVTFIVIFGCNFIISLQGKNWFSVQAYAMDEQNGQAPMRPINGGDGTVSSNIWFGYFDIQGDKAYVYVDIGWEIEGENIKNMELTVADGYFNKKLGKRDFEKIGNSVTLGAEDIRQGDMLYWGYEQPVTYYDSQPHFERLNKIVIHSVATFQNGKVEEKDIVFDMNKKMGLYVAKDPISQK